MAEASRITIRPVVAEDHETLKLWFENPENNSMFTSEFRNIDEYNKMFLLIALKRPENAYYMVEDNGVAVGFVSLIHIDATDRSGQLWYVTGDKDMRSKGVMTRAVSELLEIARQELGLRTAYTWVAENNIGSIRVLEKNGFSMFGRQRKAFFDGERFKDKLWFDKILAE